VKLFRPNNYRRGVGFSGVLNSGSMRNQPHYPFISFGKHNKIITIKNFKGKGVTIQIFKEKIVGIYNQEYVFGKKYWYRVERSSMGEVNEWLDRKTEEIRSLVDDCVRDFVKMEGLGLKGDFYWVRSETGVKNDDFLDSLPSDLVVYDTIFKKVYRDNTEFMGGRNYPVGDLKNYLNNTALNDFSPMIAGELNSIRGKIEEFSEVIRLNQDYLSLLKGKIRKLDDVFLYKEDVLNLSEVERFNLSEWLVMRFQNA